MTSQTFDLIPITSITKGDRQRKELKDVQVLADSIERLGLIHPIVVEQLSGSGYNLVAGERRLEAVRSLGWTHIPAQYAEDLDEATLHAIELEENVKRVDLSWQDQVRAVQRYHEFRRGAEPKWTQVQTADALGLNRATVTQQLQVAEELAKPEVAKAEKFSVARGLVARAEARKQDNIRVELDAPAPGPASLPGNQVILNADFTTWEWTGPKFNLIHCDFPYGVDMHSNPLGHSTSREIQGGYDDSFSTYETLCRSFARRCNSFCDSSAHLIFWFSMDYYEWTRKFLEDETPFSVDPFPLLWHKSDNAGFLPDPNRGPRRTYETAFFCVRGDRKVVRPVSNSFSGPTVRTEHMSEKPQAMLEHFFRMLVDEHSRVFDPTAGSGSALRAALALGAESVLGLELNADFAERANARFDEEIKL